MSQKFLIIKTKYRKLVVLTSGIITVAMLTGAPVLAASGYTWTPAAGGIANATYCYAEGSSSTGQYLSCANYGGDMFTSSDYGATWQDRTSTGSQYFYGTAVSGNGQYMTSVVDGGDIFTSSDYGVTWIDRTSAGNHGWGAVSISSTGQYQAATDSSANVFISSDYGATWTASPLTSGASPYEVTTSTSGQYMAVADNGGGGYVYTSNNYGASWTQRTSIGPNVWYGITMSGNGQYIASTAGSDVAISNDYGATWTHTTPPGMSFGSDIAMSSTGEGLIVEDGSNGGSVYESSNYGQNWAADTNAPSSGWFALAASSDLSRVIAEEDSGTVYLAYDPALYVAPPANSSITSPISTTPVVTSVGVKAPDTGYGTANVNPIPFLLLSTLGVIYIAIYFGLGKSSKRDVI
jgi:hypothetical protein